MAGHGLQVGRWGVYRQTRQGPSSCLKSLTSPPTSTARIATTTRPKSSCLSPVLSRAQSAHPHPSPGDHPSVMPETLRERVTGPVFGRSRGIWVSLPQHVDDLLRRRNASVPSVDSSPWFRSTPILTLRSVSLSGVRSHSPPARTPDRRAVQPPAQPKRPRNHEVSSWN